MAVAIETMTGLAKGPDVALKAMPTEPASMVRDVLRKNISNIRDSLDPESVLDVFEENNTFGNATLSIVRDLRELQSTSETNRQIRELFAKRPQLYIELKKALHKTGQCRLLKYLEESQNEVHEQHIGEREGCECELCSQAFAQCGDKCYESLSATELSTRTALRDWHLEIAADNVFNRPGIFFKQLCYSHWGFSLFPYTRLSEFGHFDKYMRPKINAEDNHFEMIQWESDTITATKVFKGRVQEQSLERENTLAMLKWWAERNRKRATLAVLCRALCASGYHHVTKELMQHIKNT